MVQALLAGRKTQTRRFVKDSVGIEQAVAALDVVGVSMQCPYGKPGDVLWVRESFFNTKPFKHFPLFAAEPDFLYKADEAFVGDHKWKPSIHMPKAACRLFLHIKKIRIERLHWISEADAKAEGVKHVIDKITGYCGYDYINGGYNTMTTPYHGFRSLWRKINGEESWEANPWVWVVEFQRVDKSH